MTTTFAPAYTARADEAANQRAWEQERRDRIARAAAGAYWSWTQIDTLDKAVAEIDRLADGLRADLEIPANCVGGLYRKMATQRAESFERLSQVAWWDERCTTALRLLWRAANGRAVEHGA